MQNPAESGSISQHRIVVGKISGIYGVAGWVKILSYTRPAENIFLYSPWLIEQEGSWQSRILLEGKLHGKGLIARLDKLDDRDVARTLIGKQIAIYREQLPELPAGEYYWSDLFGLEVINQAGISLGKVTDIRETGANDVLVVEGDQRYLIPLVIGHHVVSIDVDNRLIKVDWDPEYI